MESGARVRRSPPSRNSAKNWGSAARHCGRRSRHSKSWGDRDPAGRWYLCLQAFSFFPAHCCGRLPAVLRQTRANELVEARTLIEVELAGLAAERATPENLKQIAEQLRHMEKAKRNPQDFVQADVKFHLAIGQAASSSILMNALHLIRNLLQKWI